MSDVRDPVESTPSPAPVDTSAAPPPLTGASPGEPVTTAPPRTTEPPVTAEPPAIPDPSATPAATRKLPPTRVGAAWVALCALAVVAIALIVFMLQNTQRVRVTFLGFHASVPLALALLIATLGGILLVLVIGTIRITQLRRMARRPDRPAKSRR